uniref:Uncharacterized protein n=1 Tax=Arundo donax TaxID=35708 RepID=A0A0A8YHA0_ARUDO
MRSGRGTTSNGGRWKSRRLKVWRVVAVDPRRLRGLGLPTYGALAVVVREGGGDGRSSCGPRRGGSHLDDEVPTAT